MSDLLASLLVHADLSASELSFCGAVALLAGGVRGFAGFGLSAACMACLVLILPPVELIPVVYILECSASFLMFKGGLRDANMRRVWPLAIGSAVGVPLGLFATTSMSPELSKVIAIAIILVFTILQFSYRMPTAFDTRPGRFAIGTTAGAATGLASAGGMVIALYVLASRAQPTEMRATLTMFLFMSMFTSLISLLLYDVMTQTALIRGVVLSPLALTGVLLGTLAFQPALQKFYRYFCLILLSGLCLASLTRVVIGG